MTDSSPPSEAERWPLILVVDDEPRVRGMVLTSIRVKADRYGVVDAGADGYIVKPFSPRRLLDALDQRFPTTG
jgi:DNA-binding response OmpR family regulator